MTGFYVFVEASSETEAINIARETAREIVDESDEFEDIHPLVRIPDEADETEFIKKLANRADEFAERHTEWYADTTAEVRDGRLEQHVTFPIGTRFYDLRDGDVEFVTSRDHAEELCDLDRNDVYVVPVGVDRTYRPPSER